MAEDSQPIRNLLQLPDELLANITSLLDVESIRRKRAARPDHVALALTCTRLSGIVRNSIVRDLCFDKLDSQRTPLWDQRIGLGPSRFFDRLGPLLKFLENDSKAIHNVRSFYYRYKMVHITMLQSLFKLLSRSTSLKELTIVDCEERVYLVLQDITREHLGAFANLNRFHLEAPYSETLISLADKYHCPISLLCNITALPALQVIHIQAECRDNDDVKVEKDGSEQQSSKNELVPLRELHLMYAACGPRVLNSLLAVRKTEALFMPHRGALRQYQEERYNLDDLLVSINPLRDVLHTLSITDSSMHFYNRPDGYIELQKFTALKKLMISASLLPVKESSIEELDIRGKLQEDIFPRTLEELAVFYDGMRRFAWNSQCEELMCFYTNYSGPEHAGILSDPKDGHMFDSVMSWMIDILLRKKEDFPYLRKVTAWSCPTMYAAPSDWLYRDILPLFDRDWAHRTDGVEIGVFVKMGS